MGPERYARIRELFLAVEERPRDEQLKFLRREAGDDTALVDEVLSLLEEHDTERAIREGNAAKPPQIPSTPPAAQASPDDTVEFDDRLASASAAPFLPSQDPRADNGGSNEPVRRSRPAGVAPRPGSELTHPGPSRTHASKRYRNDSSRSAGEAAGVWKKRVRRQRRFNSGWLWLGAILPTVLIGCWTYRQANKAIERAAEKELQGLANSMALIVDRFIDDQARLVESWSRQPDVRDAVLELIEISKQEDSLAALKQAPQSEQIEAQLIALSSNEDIKFVVWDQKGTIIASWLDDRVDVGGKVTPQGAGNLARVMRGETVLFGPEVLQSDDTGFVPETDRPVMAIMVPVRDSDSEIVASMLIRGFDMFSDFDAILSQASQASGLDVYAVDGDGTMISNSPIAVRWASGSQQPRTEQPSEADFVADRLLVSDPGKETPGASLPHPTRSFQPLTYAVARVTSGHDNVRLESYRNYAGIPVIGAWRWIKEWKIGIVAENAYRDAFATARIVLWGFITLGLSLTVTALIAAAQIARRSVMSQAAVHPLSRYEVVSQLGSGGMGVVYKARHTQLGRYTALKILRGDRQNEEDQLRFDREARLAASLSSPHTVTIYDYGRNDDGEAYCVMEFLKGITLGGVIARSGFQEYGRVMFILRQICDSLGEAHKAGLVHRDIKPQNVMLSLDCSIGDWAVVFDFGLAKPLEPDVGQYQTSETVWAGTPMYMAPERFREPNKIDSRSDLYSVGCLAYFLLSGRPPFIEVDPESLFALVLNEEPISIGVHRDEAVPHEIEAMVKKCMAKRIENRFASIEELADELDRLVARFPWSIEEARAWWRVHGDDLG